MTRTCHSASGDLDSRHPASVILHAAWLRAPNCISNMATRLLRRLARSRSYTVPILPPTFLSLDLGFGNKMKAVSNIQSVVGMIPQDSSFAAICHRRSHVQELTPFFGRKFHLRTRMATLVLRLERECIHASSHVTGVFACLCLVVPDALVPGAPHSALP